MNSLPRELIIEIFHAMRLKDRWALVSTCLGFYQLLSPLLYNYVELCIPLSYAKDRFSLFFSSVQRNTHLANDVRTLMLFGPRPANVWIEDSDEISGNIWVGEEWLTDALISYGSKEKNREGETLYFHKWDTRAIVALLLIRLKNLQSLRLGYAFWYNCLYLTRIFKMEGVMKNLKEIEFHPDPPATGMDGMQYPSNAQGWALAIDTGLLRHLIQLPSIKKLSCPVWQDRTENDYWELLAAFKPLELPCSNLTCLCLPQSSLHPTTIHRILTAVPKLREFEYHQLIGLDNNLENTAIICQQLDTVWKPVLNTLRKLALGVQCQQDSNANDVLPDIRGIVRSLTNFTQLTHVSIYYRFLIDPSLEDQTELFKLLPPTLRDLKVLGTDSSRFDTYGNDLTNYEMLYTLLLEYISNKVTHAPYLQSLEVIVGYRINNRPAVKYAYTRLQKACVEAHIVFNGRQIF